jgi:hypothetical protein
MATTTLEQRTTQTRESGAELLQGRYGPDSSGTTAKVVGVVYLAGFVVGIGGTYSSNLFLVRRITLPPFPRTACSWQSAHYSAGGLGEVFMGAWLIAKGFRSSAI